jgi:hypothetical protein
MKKISYKSFIPSASLVISFIVAAAASYLLVSHFQHTILRAWLGTPDYGEQSFLLENEVLAQTPTYVAYDDAEADEGCSCPSCCAVSFVR